MKTLLINGSPHDKSSTYTALRLVSDSLEEEGVETEIYKIPNVPVTGCFGCARCRTSGKNRCMVDGDVVNDIIDKMTASDALVLGTPVYFASPNGQLISVLDRVFFAGKEYFAGKPGAAVCVARRGGTTAALEVLQKYFTICGMPIAPSTYWPMAHGMSGEEVMRDEEGVQIMRMIGKTTAWLLKCIEAGKSSGIAYPELPGGEKVSTNFIR